MIAVRDPRAPFSLVLISSGGYSAITEKANGALNFIRKFSLWITTLASLNEIFSESKRNLSRVPQETELGSVPVSQWNSPYKKQFRNLEFQLTSVSRGHVRPPPLVVCCVVLLSDQTMSVYTTPNHKGCIIYT